MALTLHVVKSGQQFGTEAAWNPWGELMATAESRYATESTTDEYDIRWMDSVLVAETTIQADFDDAGRQGFRLLADYIAGANHARPGAPVAARKGTLPFSEKMAMGVPVCQIQTQRGFLVQFTLPVYYTLASLPMPTDHRIHLQEIPSRRMAVCSYTGSWSQASYQKHRGRLMAALKRDGVATIGEPIFARFNSPLQLWFLRHNEIWVEVAP
jgi:hypothetical protein